MKEPIGFVSKEKEREIDIENYESLWVIIERINGSSVTGRLEKVFKDRVLLMPYQTVNFLNGQQRYEIARDGLPYLIERIDLSGIKQTSEENVQGFCDYSNNQYKREEFKKEIEFRKAMPEEPLINIASR